MKKKIAVIFGTRPDAIKVAPIIKLLKADPSVDCALCATGQHDQMLDQVLNVFQISPDVDFKVMHHNQSLSALTGRLMEKIDTYLVETKPDLVLAQGDTTTTYTASLASFYNRIPFGHIEAGLRTYNLQSPWPEEANRVMTSRIASLNFAPTQRAYNALIRENVPEDNIFLTGNTIVDALQSTYAEVPRYIDTIRMALPAPIMDERNTVVMFTGHRRENFDGGLERFLEAIARLAVAFPHVQYVYPVHPNPKVKELVHTVLGVHAYPNVHLIEPQNYVTYVWLLSRVKFVITDSGGMQEEAPSFSKPILITREYTERTEGIAAGFATLVGTDTTKILDLSSRLLTDDAFYQSMSKGKNPYGDGHAAERIVKASKNFLGVTE